jgi:hypothetical protein
MKRVRRQARSLETALEIVETGITKIVARLRAPVPDAKPARPRGTRPKAQHPHAA